MHGLAPEAYANGLLDPAVEHKHQLRARAWLDAAIDGKLVAATTSRALAELWATLTALPMSPRIPASMAQRLAQRYAEQLEVIELTWSTYCLAMSRCTDRGQRSGAVYDAIHLLAAESWQADVLLTFNTRHFQRLVLSEAKRPRVLAPPDPPRVESVA